MNHPDDPNLDTKGGVSVPRRTFLAGAAATAGFTIVPRHVLGGQGTTAPSDKLNVACIGIGGRGRASVDACHDQNIVGLCDVDDNTAGDAYAKYPNAKKFTDADCEVDIFQRDKIPGGGGIGFRNVI